MVDPAIFSRPLDVSHMAEAANSKKFPFEDFRQALEITIILGKKVLNSGVYDKEIRENFSGNNMIHFVGNQPADKLLSLYNRAQSSSVIDNLLNSIKADEATVECGGCMIACDSAR